MEIEFHKYVVNAGVRYVSSDGLYFKDSKRKN
jgi:hypothetical protein